MKFRTIAYDILIEKIREGKSLSLLDSERLGIRLREKIYLPDDKEIYNDPVRRATTELLGQNGGNVFWLLTGGLIESNLEFPQIIEDSSVVGSLGFKIGGLLDFYSFLPFVTSRGTIKHILADHTFDLPFTPEKAKVALPGSIFQFMGRGTAKLSGGIGWSGPQGSINLSGASEIQGNFSLRIVRESGSVVRIQLSKVHSWTREINLKAKIGWSIGIGRLIGNKLPAVDPSSILPLSLDRVTELLPDWGVNKTLSDYITEKGIGKIDAALLDYAEFYGKLGKKYTQKESNLATYRLDLSMEPARMAYNALLVLDEEKATLCAEMDNSGIDRRSYTETDTLELTSSLLQFPGHKRLLASTLIRERQGTLMYNDTTQLLRSTARTHRRTLPISGNCQITWEGLQIIVNGEQDPRSYWMLSVDSLDRNARRKEIIRFCRFSSLLGAQPIAENRISTFPWFQRLVSNEDNTVLKLILYFTSTGMEKILFSDKDTIRSSCFTVASQLGDIAPNAPWHDQEARHLMHDYCKLTDNDWGDDAEKKRLSTIYTERFDNRNLSDDSRVLKSANNIIASIRTARIESKGDITGVRWDRVFAMIGHKEKFHYMVSVGALAEIAAPDNTLIDFLELKRINSNRIIVKTDEENTLLSSEQIFINAAEQIAVATLP